MNDLVAARAAPLLLHPPRRRPGEFSSRSECWPLNLGHRIAVTDLSALLDRRPEVRKGGGLRRSRMVESYDLRHVWIALRSKSRTHQKETGWWTANVVVRGLVVCVLAPTAPIRSPLRCDLIPAIGRSLSREGGRGLLPRNGAVTS